MSEVPAFFTEEQKEAQLLMTLCVVKGRENKAFYRVETRRLLERVRNRTATDEEKKIIAWAILRMNEEREPTKNSDYARQTYALTLKYLTPEMLNDREIAEITNVDKSTVNRDINAAIKRLAFWLFGVEAIDWV